MRLLSLVALSWLAVAGAHAELKPPSFDADKFEGKVSVKTEVIATAYLNNPYSADQMYAHGKNNVDAVVIRVAKDSIDGHYYVRVRGVTGMEVSLILKREAQSALADYNPNDQIYLTCGPARYNNFMVTLANCEP